MSLFAYSSYQSDLGKNVVYTVQTFLLPHVLYNEFPGYRVYKTSEKSFETYFKHISKEQRKNIKENKDIWEEKIKIPLKGRRFIIENLYEEKVKPRILDENNNNGYWRTLQEIKRYPKQLSKVKTEFFKLKEKIKIQKEKLNSYKKKIPYNVEDEIIENTVTGLPKSKNLDRYWIDITKNNDKGEIEISVFGRRLWWDDMIKDFDVYTERLKHEKITGFRKFSHKEIISERVIRVFVHEANWIEEGIINPKFDNYKYGFKTKWQQSRLNFVKTGSALILDKELNSPTYYIATNKHVINVIIPQLLLNKGRRNVYTNHYKIPTNTKNIPPMNMSPADVFFNWTSGKHFNTKKANLKGYITFGANKPVNGDKKVDSQFLNTIFEFKHKKKDIIKSITMVNDFTYPNISESKSAYSHQWSPNKNFLKLDELEAITSEEPQTKDERLMDEIEKNSADFVILKVEFKDEKYDPFASWWKKRPTRIRNFDDRDIFNTDLVHDQDGKISNYSKLTDSNYWSVGYASYKNECDYQKKINRNKELSIKKGISENGINKWFWTRYSKQNLAGKLRFENEDWIQTRGASGSPIFDKNGNALGLLWSGASSGRYRYCHIRDKDIYNLFFWFGSNMEKGFINERKGNGKINFNYSHIPKYNFISGDRYSLLSEIKKNKPNKKTYLSQKYWKNKEVNKKLKDEEELESGFSIYISPKNFNLKT